MGDIEVTVKRIIAEELGIAEEEIEFNSSLQDDLGADELDCSVILAKIELSLGRSLPDLDLGMTFGDIIKATGIEQAASTEIIKPRLHHYKFAHKFLPQLLYKDPDYVISTLLGAQGINYLAEWWDDFGNGLGQEQLPSRGLGCEYRKLGIPYDGVVLKFPTPKGVTETLYAVIFYGIFENILRYFTFELTVDGDYVLGEWLPSGERNSRINSILPGTKDSSIDGFIDLIFTTFPELYYEKSDFTKNWGIIELERGKTFTSQQSYDIDRAVHHFMNAIDLGLKDLNQESVPWFFLSKYWGTQEYQDKIVYACNNFMKFDRGDQPLLTAIIYLEMSGIANVNGEIDVAYKYANDALNIPGWNDEYYRCKAIYLKEYARALQAQQRHNSGNMGRDDFLKVMDSAILSLSTCISECNREGEDFRDLGEMISQTLTNMQNVRI